MAAPAPRRIHWEEVPADDPPVDQLAVERRVRRERAKRRARSEHERERQLARLRFLALMGFLLFLTLFLALSVLETVRAAFGL